jgi:hypothetical protein
MQLKRLVVGKGKTSRPSDVEEWTREYYEVEAVIEDPAELEVAKAELKGLIDGWLSSSKPTTKQAPQLPQLDPDELAKLPWKNYKTKEDCKPDEAGWIFRNTKGAEALADLIEKQGKGAVVQIGAHRFDVKFSGAEKQFIGRDPEKSKLNGGKRGFGL